MAESTRPDALEGWAVHWKGALLIVAGLALLLAGSLYGMGLLYAGGGSPQIETRPAVAFPAPRLNDRLDSDPRWSFAPPNPFEGPPDPQVARAMQILAGQGDAAWGPKEAAR